MKLFKKLSWKRIHLQYRRPWFDSWVRKICWRDRLPTPVFLGFPCGSASKESACNAGDLGLIPGLGRSPGERKDYPLQYSGLENSMDCIVHGVAKSQTGLSDFHFTSLHSFSNSYSKPSNSFSKSVRFVFVLQISSFVSFLKILPIRDIM